jgi:hypothetical protein
MVGLGGTMPGCLLPAAMAAGLSTVAQWGLHAPGPSAIVPAPSEGRVVYGEPLSYRQDTAHFSIQWDTPDLAPGVVDQIAADMEAAWTGLVDEQGWDAPVSSDTYLLTVILDPDLGGTGLTYTELDPAFPEGVPVIFINSTWASEEQFMSSLCAHEFAHAVQFSVRDWYVGDETEAWYWEASAEWQAELARPEMDTYAWSSQWYAEAPHADHWSTSGYHQYGMFLLNAYLDEHAIGSDGFRDLWLDNQGLQWDQEIEDAVGEEAAWIWAGFSIAYVTGQLAESHLYWEPLTVDGSTSLQGWLGTHYIPLEQTSGWINLDAGVGALSRGDGWVVFEGGAEIPTGPGPAWLVVVNPDREPLYYEYHEGTAVLDTGEPDAESPWSRLGSIDEGEPKTGCSCASGAGTRLWYMLPLLIWRRRA